MGEGKEKRKRGKIYLEKGIKKDKKKKVPKALGRRKIPAVLH